MTIQDAVNQIKVLVENAILDGGEVKKISVIRSSALINCIHEAVKRQIQQYGVEDSRIHPPIGNTKGELKLAGFLKAKHQDVCISPQVNSVVPSRENLNNGLMFGMTDEFGTDYTERVIAINIRSQLSSMAKNFDTLYERTFAEPINLHMRCPRMVLGEVYMIPTYEYSTSGAQDHRIEFVKGINSVEKYVRAFQAINSRHTTTGEYHKYERVCLLVVDFSQKTPKIYSSDAELISDGFLQPGTDASIEGLVFDGFINDLMNIYQSRF